MVEEAFEPVNQLAANSRNLLGAWVTAALRSSSNPSIRGSRPRLRYGGEMRDGHRDLRTQGSSRRLLAHRHGADRGQHRRNTEDGAEHLSPEDINVRTTAITEQWPSFSARRWAPKRTPPSGTAHSCSCGRGRPDPPSAVGVHSGRQPCALTIPCCFTARRRVRVPPAGPNQASGASGVTLTVGASARPHSRPPPQPSDGPESRSASSPRPSNRRSSTRLWTYATRDGVTPPPP